MVICYNSQNHFAATKLINIQEYNEFKVQTFVLPQMKALMTSCADIILAQLDPPKAKAISDLQNQMDTSFHQLTGRHFRGLQTGLQPQIDPSAVPVPGPPSSVAGASDPAAPEAPVAPPVPELSGEPAPPPEEPKKKKGRKPYICHHCGKECQRKPDLEAHLFSAHEEGSGWYCNRAPCKNKPYSSKKSLKQHINRMHFAKFLWVCDKKKGCTFGTDSKQQYLDHINAHAKKDEREVFTCQKCQKSFYGETLLRKHQRVVKCHSEKVHQCKTCLKFYKYPFSLNHHISLEHVHDLEKFQCHFCAKLLSYKGSLINHMARHRQRTLAARKSAYNTSVRKHNQRSALKDFLHARSTGQDVTQSTPARLQGSKSPPKSYPKRVPTVRPSGRQPAKPKKPKNTAPRLGRLRPRPPNKGLPTKRAHGRMDDV